MVVACGKLIFSHLKKNHRYAQAKKIRFLQVKIPKKEKEVVGDAEHVQQTMKQNIEVMNQLYKNFYAIFDDSIRYKLLGNNYISMELFVEKEMIKFILGVPQEYVENVEKMISSFYIGAVIDLIPQPKILEAGKFMAGGEFFLKKESVYPIKTYESYEADPMDSLLGAYSKVNVDEKISLQVLVSPLQESWLKKLRKKSEHIKDGHHDGLFGRLWKFLFSKGDGKDHDDKESKHDFSQMQLGDFDKKLDDELFKVKIRALVTSPDQNRADKLMDDLARLFNQYNYPGLNSLRFIAAHDIRGFVKEFVQRVFHSHHTVRDYIVYYYWKTIKTNYYYKEMILNIKELSSIIHFPTFKFNKNPRISWQKYKVVPAPDNLPTE